MKEILITSSVLIIVLLVLRAVFAKSVRRTLIYGTWLLVALRLLIPVQFGELSISVLNLFQPVTETITDISDKQVAGVTEQDAHHQVMQEYIEQDQTVFLPQVQEHIQSALDEEMPKEEIVTMLDKTLPEEEIYVPEIRPQVQEKVEKTADPITLGQILWSVWGIGAVAVAIWLAVSNLRFVRKLKKTATAIAMDSPIPVFVTEKAVSPCLVGLFRPAVYLTPEVANNDQLRHYVMTHELTHYAHKDHIWSMVRCLCLCLYWFDPLVWIAAWYSRRDCELACDEGAMARLGEGQRIDYGKALLAVVQEASVPNRLMLTATTMAETKRQLRRRVHFIARKPHLSLFAAIALVLVCVIVVGCVSTGAKPQPIAEDPIVEGPAITEPTESVTPTESVAPTHTVAPTDSTISPETAGSTTEAPGSTESTTAPTAETPLATTGNPTRPTVNIIPINPTNSIDPPATTVPTGNSVTPTKTTAPTTEPTAIPTAPSSNAIVYKQGPFSRENVSEFMTLLRAKYPNTTGAYTREEHCYNNTPAEIAAETNMQFFTFALTEKTLIMTENEVFDLGIASFSPSLCERLINALPYDFDGDGVKDLLIAECRETGGSYENEISVFNPVSKELKTLYRFDNGTHDYALYVTPTNAAGQITHTVSRVKMRYTYEKDSDNPIPILKEYTVIDTAGYIRVQGGDAQFVTSPSTTPSATTVPTTRPTKTTTPVTIPTAIRPTQVVTVPTVPTQSTEKVLEIYGLGYSDSYTDYSQFDASSYNWMMQAAAEEWAAKNGYKLIFNGSYDQNKIITAMNSGERPDILFHSNTFPTIANLGLTTCFTPAEYQKLASICGEGYLDLLKISSGSNPGAHGFVLPWASNVVCYYNATMFEEYGVKSPGEYFLEGNWNWDTFAKCMEQMTCDIDADGTTDTYGLASASWENLVNPWATSPTGQLISTINEPWMKAYFQLKYDAYSVKKVTATGGNKLQTNVIFPMFAMQLSECRVYDFQQLYQTIPNGNKVRVVPVPAYEGNNILQFTQACASLAATCDQREAAVDLLAYILQCGMKYMSDYSLGAVKCDYEGLQGTCQQSVWYLSAFQKALKDRAKALQKEFDYDEQLIAKMYDSFAEAQWYTKLNVPGVTALTNFTEIPHLPPASSIPAVRPKYQAMLDQYNNLYIR